ncbi:MAG: sigma 54-interacting transcriptional regulator [Nannocystaceae bacterium]|nr:sigma 54-interacting transcriptional regulator [Nannocystaceae bacterium]
MSDRAGPTLTLAPDPALALVVAVIGGAAVPLRGRVRIGSAPPSELLLRDRFVSSLHAEVCVVDGRAVLRDLGSKNGTWLDGRRIDTAPWPTGTPVRVGATVLELRLDPAALAGAAADGATALPSALHRVRAPAGAAPMIGEGAAMRRLLDGLRRVAASSRPVLLTGETGTGKELAAAFVHRSSARAQRPMVAISCATLVDNLAESQLFGHARGAFTGAVRPHAGAFVRADGGTLFLDEIGELPLLQQAKLLRVLETAKVQPLGSEAELDVDVRLVCATHRDLPRMVARGEFREDLFHRIGVLALRVPPLRERGHDIAQLLEHFALEAARELGRPVGFAPGCVALALQHPWPGNIRALRNAVLRAAALGDGPITAAALLGPATPRATASDLGTTAAGDGDVAYPVTARAGVRPAMDRAQLQRLVAQHGSIRRAAIALGMPRGTLAAQLRRGTSAPPPDDDRAPAGPADPDTGNG